MQIEQINFSLIQYDTDLIELSLETNKPIDDLQEDNILGEKMFTLLNKQLDFSDTNIINRQHLLKSYLARYIAENSENNFSIDVQGKKLVNALNSNLISYPDLWEIIEESIQEYCHKGSYRMLPQEHRLFNKHIFNINQAYTQANFNQQLINNTLFNSNFFNTQKSLNASINTIASYYDHIDQKTQILTASTAPQTTDLENKSENTIEDKNSPATQTSPEEEKTIQEVFEEKTAIIVETTQEDSTIPNPELNQKTYEGRKPISRQERKLLKKRSKAKPEKQQKDAISQPAMSAGRAQEDIEVQVADLSETKKQLIKTPEMRMLEYITINDTNDLVEKNYDKFFSCAKACYNSESTKNQAQKILQELESSTDNITTLLYIAKLKLDCHGDSDLIVKLLHGQIGQHASPDFITKIVETGMHKQLIKWANGSTADEIREHETVIIEYIKSITTPENSGSADAKLENLAASLDIIKKWLSASIKLLQSINQKTDFIETKMLLIKLCLYYGHGQYCDNFIIKPEELKKQIETLNLQSVEEYLDIARNLLLKKKATANALAIDCYRICVEKFQDIQSMRMINMLLEQNDSNLYEREKLLRKVLEIEPKSEIDKYDLAKILFNRYKANLPTNIKEIEDNLKNNSLERAKKLYVEFKIISTSDSDFNQYILNDHIDPETLTNIIVDKIKSQNKVVSKHRKLFICRSIQCLTSLIVDHADQKEKEACQAINDYLNPKQELTAEDKLKLRETIYKHPVMTKMCDKSKLFQKIINAWEEKYTKVEWPEIAKNFDIPELFISAIDYIITNSFKLTSGTNEIELNNRGETILHYTSATLKKDVVKFLTIEHKELLLKSNISDHYGMTPVTRAINNRLRATREDDIIDIIDILYDAYPEMINTADSEGDSPIHNAAELGLVKVFEHLIKKYDINFFQRNHKSQNTIDIAIRNNQINILKYLLKTHRDQISDGIVKEMFFNAICCDQAEVAEYLFSEILTLEYDKEDPIEKMLQLALEATITENNHIEIIKTLMDQDVIKVITDKDQSKKPENIVKELIEMIQVKKQEIKASNKKADFKNFDIKITYLIDYLKKLKKSPNSPAAI